MKKIYIIDGNSFIYRMFYAIPEFSTKSGKQVNAIFGMAKFFIGLINNDKPDYLIFIKDAKGENFRHKLYSEYKATRDKMPDNLRDQMNSIEEMISLMNIDIVEISGYEADDVIATLAEILKENQEDNTYILSGDKDLFNLVDDRHNISIYDTMKKKIFNEEDTTKRFGVEPRYIPDYLSIVGDTSDNVPGVPGVGPKKAEILIKEFGHLELIYEEVDKIQKGERNDIIKGKFLENLVEYRELAFLSKKLVLLDKNINLGNFDLQKFTFHPEKILNKNVLEFFKSLEFFSLLPEENKKLVSWEELNLKVNIIGDKEGLSSLEKDIQKYDEIVLDTETTSLDPMESNLVGVSIYLDDDHIYYINLRHSGPQVDEDDLSDFLDKLLQSDKLIIGHNLKYDLEVIEVFQRKIFGKDSSTEEENHNLQMSLGI